jgi:hypothetical protein
MRKNTLPLLCLFFAAGLYAQQTGPDAGTRAEISPVFSYPLSAESRPRYDAVCGELSRQPLITGRFEQIRTNSALGRSLVSRGKFIIAAELGMIWETESPVAVVMVLGRDYIRQYTGGISTPKPGAGTQIDAGGSGTFLYFADAISAIFTGNPRRLLENFENYFSETGGTWTLGLIPREQALRSVTGSIVLFGDSVIRTIEIRGQNNDLIRYTLSEHQFPESLSPEERALF